MKIQEKVRQDQEKKKEFIRDVILLVIGCIAFIIILKLLK